MGLSNWFQSGLTPANALQGTYDLDIVFLSYVIAVFASYVALDFIRLLRREPLNKSSFYWLLGGGFAMGAGIWSMHFIGMLAFVMPMPMIYGTYWTVGSILVAILASIFALKLVGNKEVKIKALILGGICLGLGIATMHYMGMEAMTVHVNVKYIPRIFILSIIIAILASEVAFWLALEGNKRQKPFIFNVFSAFVMGVAICGMHYTGMAATVFTPLMTHATVTPANIDSTSLAYYVTLITGVILLIAILFSTYKHSLRYITQNQAFLNAILNNLSDGVVACDSKGKITVLNNVMQKMLGVTDKKLKDPSKNNISILNNAGDKHPYKKQLLNIMAGKSLLGEELELKDGELNNKRNFLLYGQEIINEHGEKLGAVLAYHDITRRKQMEEELIHQATHDSLTNLPNRKEFNENVQRALENAKRNNRFLALMLIDIDNFKNINDAHGHQMGDRLLIDVSDRLRNSLRRTDYVAMMAPVKDLLARLGGDEFIIMMDLQDPLDVGICARRIIKEFHKPFEINQQQLYIKVSIGIVTYPEGGEDLHTLVKNADIAMYRAKEAGKNNFQFFTEEMGIAYVNRLTLENALLSAIANESFELVYQPQYNLKTKKLRGLEALCRWNDEKLGSISPTVFIPIAERTGHIISLGNWVFRHACAQYMLWLDNKQIPQDTILAINVSPFQLIKDKFSAEIKKILKETKMPPNRLEIEITETALMTRLEGSQAVLEELMNMGLTISIDDFGTGYSSLSHIKRLPITTLKIDKSFIQNAVKSTHDGAIVKSILALAKALGLNIIAEGPEEEDQVDFLVENACNVVQGFYFAKPMLPEKLINHLVNWELQNPPGLCYQVYKGDSPPPFEIKSDKEKK